MEYPAALHRGTEVHVGLFITVHVGLLWFGGLGFRVWGFGV